MVDFIYGRFPRLRVGSDICEMFEIENVAEKFRILGLKDEYKSSMMLYFRHLYKDMMYNKNDISKYFTHSII